MKENKETKETESYLPKGGIDDTAMSVYKWLKIVQSLILVSLGAMFIVCAYLSNGLNNTVLPICLGIVFSAFGLMEFIAGYYLRRSIIGEEILFGGLSISFAVVLFVNGEFITEILSNFMVALFIFYALALVVFGVDRLLGKSPVKKSVMKAVFAFLGAALLAGLDIFYLIERATSSSDNSLDKWMVIVAGALMVVIGILALTVLLVKIHNTNRMMNPGSAKEPEEDSPTESKNEVLDKKHRKEKVQLKDKKEAELLEGEVLSIEDTKEEK